MAERMILRMFCCRHFVCASKEVINFCRLSMIIHTLCSDATRDVIKHFLGPTNIDITRQILSKTHHFKYGIRNVKIFPHEKSYFFPPANCTVDIEKADFSLMYKLFRNFDSPMLDAKEKAKWEKTPSDSDQGIVAALERIRNARNAFVAHPSSAKTDDQEFEDICKQLSISLKAIDSGLGTAHFDRIQEMKTIILDDSMVTTQLKLSESNRKLEETQRKLEAFEAVDTRTGNTKTFLSAKFRKEKYCVETEAFRTARQQLEEKKKLWILGKAGAGKTRLAVRLLYHFIVKCRGDIIVRKISKPSEIRNLYNANSEKNTILFVDDAFGKTVVDRNLAEKWCKAFDFINSLCKSGRATVGHLWILYTSRNYILQAASEEEVVLLKSVKDFVLDLSSQEHDLKHTEKHAILDIAH
ncbi:hypothetical protein FSP39_010357 [Pinctada imbricata]|uniref:DZIP3-like HEPN domain-containing protein n=1 Tax=Pinctada imbricata TaxID=66713 RepID=A0AA89BVC7_PINIB|nr:hypothetical protein FSP39_010357 [Pinctada imbricata]